MDFKQLHKAEWLQTMKLSARLLEKLIKNIKNDTRPNVENAETRNEVGIRSYKQKIKVDK